MGSVWKRLQRVNKRAAKFQFTVSYREMKVETTTKWRPTNLQVVWTRRSRRVVSEQLSWNSSIDPLVGNMNWPIPDNHAITVTLFKDPRTHELEEKKWTFVLEDISTMGKRRALAQYALNLKNYASIESTQQTFTIQLRPVNKKITSAEIELTISCVFLREGKATDEDMMSVISLMSVKDCSDIAPLDDLEEDIPDLESSGDISDHVVDFTQQLEQLTSSLNSPEPQTPRSVPSIAEDPPDSHTFDSFASPTSRNEANHIIKPETISAKIELIAGASRNETSDRIDSSSAALRAGMAFPEELESKKPKEKPTNSSNKTTGSLFHSFNFKDEKPAPLASPEQDKLPEKEPEPPKLVHKPPEIKKRIELQPLNLKKSYDYDNEKDARKAIEAEKSRTGTLGRDKTPGQDLLEWCKDVTKHHENVKVTNLTTSFKNGMAFAAIISHYRPDLIDLNNLIPSDIVGNCKKAFEAGEKLGIPKVIEPSDMSLLAVPDKLAVMTYLFQLHAHFTGRQLEVDIIGPTTDESKYVIGSFKSDSLSASNDISASLHDIKHQLLMQRSNLIIEPNYQKSPSIKFMNGANVLSPGKDGVNGNEKPMLMTRRELTDPFGSDEEEEKTESRSNNKSPPKEVLSPLAIDNKIVNRHKQQSEKAKELIEKLRPENCKSIDIDESERQTRLREHARRLIAETRAKSINLDSPSSPVRSIAQRITLSPERTISPINNNVNQFNYNTSMPGEENSREQSPGRTLSPRGKSPLQTLNILDRISPKAEMKLEKTKYIQSELDALEREQESIDQKANELEKKLRAVMGGNVIGNEAETEDQLMAQWFTLVNKKNALLRRQMQLNILEQESDLERKHDLLNLELRAAMSVEDWRKTEEQRDREKLLLAELVSIVDKRNELVLNLHSQEQAIEDDEDIQRKLVNVDINHKEKCSIM